MKRVRTGNGKNGKNDDPVDDLPDADAGYYEARVMRLPEKRGAGRPSLFKPEYNRTARAMCQLGATDAELASEFGVNLDTIYSWRIRYKDFADACTVGKDAFDDRAERTLAQLAVGFHYKAEELKVVDKEVVRVEVLKYHPPEFLACMAWLRNRKPEAWRTTGQAVAEMNGTLEIKDPQGELERRLLGIARRRSDGDGDKSKLN